MIFKMRAASIIKPVIFVVCELVELFPLWGKILDIKPSHPLLSYRNVDWVDLCWFLSPWIICLKFSRDFSLLMVLIPCIEPFVTLASSLLKSPQQWKISTWESNKRSLPVPKRLCLVEFYRWSSFFNIFNCFILLSLKLLCWSIGLLIASNLIQVSSECYS